MNNFKKRYLAVACSAIWLAGCNGGGSNNSSTTPATTHCTTCTMFVTESQFNGNLILAARNESYTGESIGVYAADYLCNVDESNPDTSKSYKAFITDGVNRYACTSPDCSGGGSQGKDWVLYPNTNYAFINESLVFTSNSSSIYVFGTLQSSSPYPTAKQYWTGIGAYRTPLDQWLSPTISGSSCDSWNNSSGSHGGYGKLLSSANPRQQTNSFSAAPQFISATRHTANAACNVPENLLCVQQ